MLNKYGQKLGQKYPFFSTCLLLMLIKLTFVEVMNSDDLKPSNNYDSEIHLITQGKGTQNILNNAFEFDPSEVIVNGYLNNSCKKTCYLTDDINNITLKFSELINSCEKMFKGLENILEIDLSYFDVSQVTSMHEMFKGCSYLVNVILSNSNTYKLNNISSMFYSCKSLETINFGHIDTSSVENMQHLFCGCSQISSIDLSKLDTSKVTSMFSMFYNCSNLKSINFGNINTSSVLNMRSLFNKCSKLSSINLSSFDTSKVKEFQYMFQSCSELTSIDLSNFDTSNAINMSSMFYSCMNLKIINFGNINTSSVKDMNHLFYGCSKISSIDFSKFDFSKVTSMNSMFFNCYNLISINFGNINTSSVESMKSLFNGCTSITSIDLSKFDMSKVTLINYMFYSCYNLETINFGNINTSSVENMQNLFSHCLKISSIDISKFDTSKVTNMLSVFWHCENLETVNFGNINTSSVKTMRSLFNNCSNIISIDLSKFDTSQVVSFENMFSGCKNLKYLDLSNFDASNLLAMDYMFNNCKSLKYLNLYSFQLNQIINKTSVIKNTPSDLIFCIKDNYTKNYIFGNDKINICLEPCSNDINKKIGIAYDGCVKSCLNNGFEYEYKNICYHECPINAYPLFYDDKDIINESKECFDQAPQGYYLDINAKSYKKCYELCKSCYGEGNETYNNCIECKENYASSICVFMPINNESITQKIITTSTGSQLIYECKNDDSLNSNCHFLNTKNETEILNIIQQNMNSFDSENGKSQVIEGGNGIVYQITNPKNEKELLQNKFSSNQNLTILDLGKCEDKLKKEFKINDNDSLIFLKKENTNVKPSEKNVEYEIYEPYNFTKLDLSICKEEKINLYVPLILSDETKNIYESMKSYGYDMYNINDPFYQDLCTKYTTLNNTDIPLSARKDYIYNNQDSQCQANCHFSGYIPNTSYINCICDIEQKEEIVIKAFSGETLYKIFYDVLKYANFDILKCYNLVFNIQAFKNNIGNFVVISIFFVNLICLFSFIIKGITPLKNKIKNLISDSNEEIDNKNNIFIYNLIFQNNISHNIKNKIPSNPKKKKKSKSKYKKKNKEKKIKNKLTKNLNFSSNNAIFNSARKNLNNIKNSQIEEKENKRLDKFELNQLEYEEAIFFDKRAFINIYWDILCREHIIIFTFFICNDYNISFIKYARFIFLFTTDMAMNVFFFSDESMHKIYLNYGKFNFIQQIPQVIYTAIISQLLEVFLCFLSLTDQHIYQIKKITNAIDKKEILKILKCIKIKLVIFFIFTFICFIFYWYTITSFCAVYENTQITFIKDSLLSFLLGIIYPFIIYLIPSLLRIIALRNSKKNLKFIYKLSDIIPFF